MTALREILWTLRMGQALLCAAACRAAIARERVALDRALQDADNARAHLRSLEHEQRPGIPAWLLRRS